MESIGLLEIAGIDFNKFKQSGIEFQTFAELFINSGLVLNDNIHWITFHGSYDLAYLLKLISGVLLPSKEEVFYENLDMYFPNYYDIKAIIQDLNMKGTLSKIASDLGVKRVGNTHQAGSDSLVTSRVFFQLISQYSEQIDLPLYKNKLFGLGNNYDEYGQNNGNYNYFINNNLNMYGNKAPNAFKNNNINSNIYFPNSNNNNFTNYNTVWNNQSGNAYNIYGNFESVNPNSVNPYFQQTGVGDMYMNNTNNMGYPLQQNVNSNLNKINGNGGSSKDGKNGLNYNAKMK